MPEERSREFVNEVKDGFPAELDYVHEARSMGIFGRLTGGRRQDRAPSAPLA